jgi:hypothetical protein
VGVGGEVLPPTESITQMKKKTTSKKNTVKKNSIPEIPANTNPGDLLVLYTTAPIETPDGWNKISDTLFHKIYKK